MPRKSIAAITTPRPNVDGSPHRLQPRPGAPATVKRIFADLVASVPAAHFRPGDSDLIEQYAQAIALARQAYREIEKDGPVVEGKASPWVTVLEKQHRSCVALSMRLRLSPQQRTDPKSVARQGANYRPSAYDTPWPWEATNGN